MLYQIGAISVSVRPFNVHEVDHKGEADFADKDLLGRRKGSEFVGEGKETLQLKGTVLPFSRGGNGLPAIEAMHGQRRAGRPVFVMRGDGRALGWYRIDAFEDSHRSISSISAGVGHEITHELRLTRVDSPGLDGALSQLDQLLSLFG